MAEHRKKKVSQTVIAEDAGVSRATVSLVMRNSDLVTPDTRERVLAAAKRLGYIVPARTKASGGSRGIIGIVFPDITNVFYSSLLVGINEFFDEKQEYTLFFNSTFDLLDKQQRFLRDLSHFNLRGLIISPAVGTTPKDLEWLKDSGVELVFCPRSIEGVDVSVVDCDYKLGAYTATTHLIENNHRRIAFLGGREGISPFEDRLTGYKMALAANGIPFDESIKIVGPVTRSWGRQAVSELLSRPDPPTAILCYNDTIARGVLQGLDDLHLTLGRDVAVVGFDNTDDLGSNNISSVSFFVPKAEISNPHYDYFTSVSAGPYQWGYEAAKILYRQITGLSRESVRVLLPQQLIVRASSNRRF